MPARSSGVVLRLSTATGWIAKWMRRWRGHAIDPCHPKVRKDCISQDFPEDHGINIGRTFIHTVYRFNDKQVHDSESSIACLEHAIARDDGGLELWGSKQLLCNRFGKRNSSQVWLAILRSKMLTENGMARASPHQISFASRRSVPLSKAI